MKVFAARWVCPIVAPPIENGCVGVNDAGDITFVGPRSDAPPGTSDDLGNAILLPGLVNAHTHLDLTLLRGQLHTAEFFEWIRSLVARKSAVQDEDFFLAGALVGIAEGLRAGITSYADTSDNGASMRAMLRTGVRGIAYQEVFGPAPADCDDSIRKLRQRVHLLRELETTAVRVGVSPHAPYTVSDDLYKAVSRLAVEEFLPVAVHVAESDEEDEFVRRGAGPFGELLRGRGLNVEPRAASSIELLRTTGILDTAPLLIHAVRVGDADIPNIQECGATVVHCPWSNKFFGHGTAPVLKFRDHSIPVALGTDSTIDSGAMDLLAEARAARQMHGEQSADGLRPQDLVRMLTLDGAKALGMDSIVGSLEVGKRADLAAFSLDEVQTLPDLDPYAALLSLGVGSATLAVVSGRVLQRNGVLEADPVNDPVVVRANRQLAISNQLSAR